MQLIYTGTSKKKPEIKHTLYNEDPHAQYELFCVVNHHGSMDTGHYISYVRHNSLWFKCDDAFITQAQLQQVLKTKAYVLFYMKKHLEYKKRQHPS